MSSTRLSSCAEPLAGIISHLSRSYFKRATGDHVIKAKSASDWTNAIEESSVTVLLVTDDDAHDGTVQVRPPPPTPPPPPGPLPYPLPSILPAFSGVCSVLSLLETV